MKDQIERCIAAAIDEVNAQRPDEPPIPHDPQFPLIGKNSSLDSLGLMNLVVALEERLEKAFGKVVVLADDRALSQPVSPFSSLSALANYCEMILSEAR